MVFSPLPPVATAAPRILIVEDEGIIANHIATRLVKTGYEVAGIAESSDEVFARIAELSPELILMDIRIKGAMDGIQTAARIHEQYDIPVIYLTAHSDQETINRAKLTGASGFLTKPIHHTSLATTIEMAIHKHRADSAARHQRAWMATVLGTMADAIVVIDRDQKVQYLNAPAQELTGWTNDTARDQDLATILPLSDSASGTEVRDIISPEIGSPFQMPRGLVASSRSGRWFPVEGEVSPSTDGNRIVGAVITFRDATVRQEQESELRQEYKMQAVGRLAAGIAHDFNNLLFVILGYTEEMLRKSVLADSDRRALTTIRNAGDSAVGITKQLLNFSRKEPGVKQEISLNDVVRDTEDLFRRLGAVNVTWNINLAPKPVMVKADHGQLKQVLMNLVSNACDALQETGTITIETANVDLPRTDSPMSTREAYVSMSVSDTGIGMSAHTAEHLFEPFFTTRDPGKGTGLGLSIVHSIVTDLGGTIHVESEPGKGACFTVYLPRAGSEGLNRGGEAHAGEEPAEPPTILLADDQEDVRGLLRAYLSGSEYTLLEAESGQEAIRLAGEHPRKIDLLITDIVMPNGGGFEVARALTEKQGSVRTIFISGFAQELLDSGEKAPFGARFLPKPFARNEFLKTVAELLAQARKKTMRAPG